VGEQFSKLVRDTSRLVKKKSFFEAFTGNAIGGGAAAAGLAAAAAAGVFVGAVFRPLAAPAEPGVAPGFRCRFSAEAGVPENKAGQ
jgi:hypothetical protein